MNSKSIQPSTHGFETAQETLPGTSTTTGHENSEKVVTIFDLSFEIEQALENALKEIDKNESEFQKSLKSIQTRLCSIDSQLLHS